MPSNTPNRRGTDLSQLHLGLEFVGGTLLFAGLGYWLDGRWGTAPWLAVIGGALGFAGGMWLLIKEAMKANREAARKFGKRDFNAEDAEGRGGRQIATKATENTKSADRPPSGFD